MGKDNTRVKEVIASQETRAKSQESQKSRIPGITKTVKNDGKGKQNNMESEKGSMSGDGTSEETPSSGHMPDFTEALHRIESVFVETIQNMHIERNKVQDTVYLKEIEHLKSENSRLKHDHDKELQYLKKQHELEEQKLKEDKCRMEKENVKAKENQSRIQGQYDRAKKEYDSLLQAHTKQKTTSQSDLENLNKAVDASKAQVENDKKDIKAKTDEIQRQKNEINDLRNDIEQLEEMARKHRKEIENAHDEIITLKNTIGATKNDLNEFTEVKQKQPAEEARPETIYFKGAHDPLSNMYYVKEGLRICTHVFYYSETAYQWRKAVHSNDFASAQKILNSKDGYEAKEIADNDITIADGWEGIKEDVMSEILDEKFERSRRYREALQKSKNAILVENTTNTFWARGKQNSPGQNKLGELHMKKREKCLPENNDSSISSHTDDHKQSPHQANVLLVGNSHTSHNFRLSHLNRDIALEKRAAMTISQAKKEVEQIEEKWDVIVLHELTNDIGRNEAEAVKCSNDFLEVVNIATKKGDKVVVSLGLPRNDDDTKHEMTQMTNWQLKSRLKGQPNIVICEHENMLHYGKPNQRYLAWDQYHLSTMGKVVFARNLSRSIHIATGLPAPRSPDRSKGGFNDKYDERYDDSGYNNGNWYDSQADHYQ